MKRSVAQSIKWKLDHGEPIFALNYARTSTLKDEQKDSCDNQVAMAKMYLNKNPNIILAEPPYVDKGISGKSNLHRDEYESMIERLKRGDIDLLIVKTKARLCRSKAISATLEEMMRDYKFSILTLSDGQIYDSSDRSSRLINGIKDVIDEDYVWGQSEYGKLTHQLRCERKILTNCAVVYGYSWDREKRDIVINPEEAAVIKNIFEWYVYEDLGVSDISKRLASLGIYGKNSGNKISARCLTNWLSNEAYAGTFYINKRGSDLELGNNRETKRYKLAKEEWIPIPRPDLAIITPELFELASRCKAARVHVYDKPSEEAKQARFKGFHLFASKIFCGECGSQFIHVYTDRKKTISAYRDYFSRRTQAINEECANLQFRRVYESTMAEITREAINRLVSNREDIISNVKSIIAKAIEENEKTPTKKVIDKRESIKEKLEAEKVSYYEGWRTAPTEEMKKYFLEKIQELAERLSEFEDTPEEKNENEEISLEHQLEMIEECLRKFTHISEVDREVVETFVDRISVFKDGKVNIVLKTGNGFNTCITDNGPGGSFGPILHAVSLFFSVCVEKLCKQGMMDRFLQDMVILQKI